MNSEIKDGRTLLEWLREQVATLRSIQLLIERKDFQNLFDSASEAEREKVRAQILSFSRGDIRLWYKTERKKVLGILGVRELREMARDLLIPNYTLFSKAILISIIAQRTGDVSGNNAPHHVAASRDEGSNAQSGS